jgi:hypothetical protein
VSKFYAIDVPAMKHICLVGNNCGMVQGGNDARFLRSGHHEAMEVVAMRRYGMKPRDMTASC